MQNTHWLLFENTVNGQPLFKNQQDLVNQIIQQPGTVYYVDRSNIENYARMQNRLKAYVSQLLSPKVIRNITPDFERALKLAIQRKTDDIDLTERLGDEIIDAFKIKRPLNPKAGTNADLLDQLSKDFRNGKYISVITGRPLEVEAEMESDTYSLRKLFFKDFIQSLEDPNVGIKDYRFNFPVESSGQLFWKGLNKLLIKHLRSIGDKKGFLNLLRNKLGIEVDANFDLFSGPTLSDADVHSISQTLLMTLRRECKLVVFTCDAPIFTLPIIVIDPAEIKTARIYAIIDRLTEDFTVYKFSHEEVVLWRLFVWDKIQSQAYKGKPVEPDRVLTP